MPSVSRPSGDRVQHLERGSRPRVDDRAVRRHVGERSPAPRRAPSSGSPASQAPRLAASIAPGPAAGGDDVAATPSAWPSRAASAYAALAALAGRARPSRRPATARRDPRGERDVDGVVVQRLGQRVVAVGAAAGTRRRRGRRGTSRSRRCRRARRRCRAIGAVGVDRHAGQRRAAPARRRAGPTPRRRRRRCSRGTSAAATEAPRSIDPALGQVEPDAAASPPSRSRPRPAVRSRSARESTSTTRPRVCLTPHDATAGRPDGQNACAISSPNSSCSSTSSPRARNQVQTLVQSRSRKSMPVRVADQVDDLRQVDDHQPVAGGQDVVRRQVAVHDPACDHRARARRAAGRSTTPAAPGSGRVWASRGAVSPSTG